MADKFVRVRLLRIQGYDLNLFEFDFDLTWTVFFMHADGKMYGRYGGRDASGADSRNTLLGLRYAMEAAHETHKERAEMTPPALEKPLFIDKLPAARRMGSGCIHCHQVKEILRAEDTERGTWKREQLWTYPLPENVGVTADKDKGNLVEKVAPRSAAAQVGVQGGDLLEAINGMRVRSFADFQYALHKAPLTGEIGISWKRGDKLQEAKLALADGWKKTNITWRPSMLDLLPSLTIYGDDLSSAEKKKLGLEESRLAFRQKDSVHSRAQAMGIKAGDIILGVNDQKMEGTVDSFLAHIRRNYIVGDRVTINLVRDGKRLDLPVKLGN